MIFNFLEAYLNGLAYDCFHTHHNKLPIRDHDLLAEWDSQKKQTRLVSFDVKIFKYPRVVGRSDGRDLDLGDRKAAHFLAQQGKTLRDAVVHPSAFVHPWTGNPEKLHQITSLNYALIEQLFQAAKEYVETVEQRLGYDPPRDYSLVVSSLAAQCVMPQIVDSLCPNKWADKGTATARWL